MTLKDKILNKVKSISDEKVLHELDEWNRKMEKKRQEQINEPTGQYRSKNALKNRDIARSTKKEKPQHRPESAIDYLEKIAKKGGVDGIEDPVEWQKKERQDRSLKV